MASEDGTASPSYLKICLEERYASILPDLLLLDVDDVSYMQHNDSRNSYIYALCALLLDCHLNQIEVYCTQDGLEHKDGEECCLLKNSDADKYKGGMYMCKCLLGIYFYHMINRLDIPIFSLENLSRSDSTNTTPCTSAPATPVKQTASSILLTQSTISSSSLDSEGNPRSKMVPLQLKRKRISAPSHSVFSSPLFADFRTQENLEMILLCVLENA